jgi:uncharacterized Zn finger protein
MKTGCTADHQWETTHREIKYGVWHIVQKCKACGMVRFGTMTTNPPYDEEITWGKPHWAEETP